MAGPDPDYVTVVKTPSNNYMAVVMSTHGQEAGNYQIREASRPMRKTKAKLEAVRLAHLRHLEVLW